MKVLYAGLVAIAIALSGCPEQLGAIFFPPSMKEPTPAQRELDAARRGMEFESFLAQKRAQECARSKLMTGYVASCSPNASDHQDEQKSRGDLSDLRLKRDVVRVGALPSGIPLYEFNYIWGGPRYIGVMAQDVLKVTPEAVSVDEYGFYRVDYSMIGTRMALAEDQPKHLYADGSALLEQSNVASH